MPVNDRYPLEDVLATCRRYFALRHRKVFVEYVMLGGVNDSPAHARDLAALLDPQIFKVNLIPYNPTGMYDGSSRDRIAAFKLALDRTRVPSTVRLTRGRDIEAACGQLGDRAESAQALRGRAGREIAVEQRVSLVTLGVADLARAREFYEALSHDQRVRAVRGEVGGVPTPRAGGRHASLCVCHQMTPGVFLGSRNVRQNVRQPRAGPGLPGPAPANWLTCSQPLYYRTFRGPDDAEVNEFKDTEIA